MLTALSVLCSPVKMAAVDKAVHLPLLGKVLCVRNCRRRLAFVVLTFVLPLKRPQQQQHLRRPSPRRAGSLSAGASDHQEKTLGAISSRASAHRSTVNICSLSADREVRHSSNRWRRYCVVADGAVAEAAESQHLREARQHDPEASSSSYPAESTTSGACCTPTIHILPYRTVLL